MVRDNNVVIIVGETGSGKTTQLTQVQFRFIETHAVCVSMCACVRAPVCACVRVCMPLHMKKVKCHFNS